MSDCKCCKWQREYELSLNRRVQVENYLLKAFGGDEELTDKDKCKELALKLGVPDSWRDSKQVI